MEEEEDDMALFTRRKATMQISDKGLQDLLSGIMITKEDRPLERLEDVQTLTEIIQYHRKKRARSSEIALAIIKFVKEG